MARRSSTLRVLLNGRQVGWLSRAANGAIDFRYAQEWLDWEYVSPVSLSLPLGTRRYTGSVVTAVFDNLLPDNDDIRRRIAGRVALDHGRHIVRPLLMSVLSSGWVENGLMWSTSKRTRLPLADRIPQA